MSNTANYATINSLLFYSLTFHKITPHNDNVMLETENQTTSDQSGKPDASKTEYKEDVSKKKHKLTSRQILVILLIIFLGLFTIVINQPHPSTNEKLPSQQSKQITEAPTNFSVSGTFGKLTQQTPSIAATPTQEPHVPGTIQWKDNPSVITNPQLPLSYLNQLTYDSAPNQTYEDFITPQLQFYTVGTWTSGPYKGNPLVDVIISESLAGENGPVPGVYIVRVTPDGGELIYFFDSSSAIITDAKSNGVTYLPDNKLFQTDMRLLPNLLINTPPYSDNPSPDKSMLPYPVRYNGKTETFDLTDDLVAFGANTWNPSLLSNYSLVAKLPNGRKLYAIKHSDFMTYSSIESNNLTENDIYVIEDVDHSLIPVNTSASEDIVTATGIKWQTPPLLPTGLFGSPPNLWYTTSFQNGCTFIPTSKLAGETGFTSDQLQLVGSFEGQQLYVPTNAPTLFQAIYSYLTPDIPLMTPAVAQVSYTDYLKTYPVLIGKDAFGEYQIYYRLGYPDNMGGCGKPVIYLYPTKKTSVSVHFSKNVSVTKSLPTYSNGWNVTAFPDGTIINSQDQKSYPYLFWEGVTNLAFPKISTGFVTPKSQVQSFLTDQLSGYGLNATEMNGFLSYWVPKMQQDPYYLIHFYTTSDLDQSIPEYITPKPDTVFRILMWFHPLSAPVTIPEQQNPTPFKRLGFTVVEWGGVEN